ncbi:MAG: ATP-binding cassette domain-containing protein, partial [Flavobacteriaceae bacterium]
MGLQIEHLVKNYGNTPILKDINLSLKKGEIVGFLGPNGAGKTTLMKILTGSLSNWQGNIHFNTL